MYGNTISVPYVARDTALRVPYRAWSFGSLAPQQVHAPHVECTGEADVRTAELFPLENKAPPNLALPLRACWR